MDYDAAKVAQMRRDMEVVFTHYNLSPEARKTATASAIQRVGAASICYRCIAHSLAPTVERGADAAAVGGRASGESAAGTNGETK